MALKPKTGLYIGLGISGVIILLLVIIVVAIASDHEDFGPPTAATDPPNLKKIELNLDLARLVSVPGGDGAQAAYAEAVRRADAMGLGFIEHIKESPDPTNDPQYKGILEKLEEAADKGLAGELNFDNIDP